MSQAGSRDNTARKRSTASSGNTGSGRKSAGGIARNRTSASGGKSSGQGAARNSKSSSGKGKSSAKGSNSRSSAAKRAANEKEEYEQLTIKDAYVKKKNSMIDELIVGVVLLFSIICFLGVIDKGGIVGKYLKYFLFGTFGIFGYVAPILILLATVVIVYIGKDIPVVKSLLGVLVFVNLLAIIQLAVHYDEKLHFYEYYKYCGENLNGGGFLGALILSMLAPLFGKTAAIIVAIIVIIICLVLITEKAIFRSISISSGKAAKKEVER
ncbi:MAG: DNA translocase FtsK 4TM domain-containing protein, partial [Lachnospiraceae bacterium]|nr:DNA translocase FtsK 4TM domain-containing protein [Lachnospiraceae bacterium]